MWTWGPPGSCRPQVGPMLAPWTLLSGTFGFICTGNYDLNPTGNLHLSSDWHSPDCLVIVSSFENRPTDESLRSSREVRSGRIFVWLFWFRTVSNFSTMTITWLRIVARSYGCVDYIKIINLLLLPKMGIGGSCSDNYVFLSGKLWYIYNQLSAWSYNMHLYTVSEWEYNFTNTTQHSSIFEAC